MEKTRVKSGEKYWFIIGDTFICDYAYDKRSIFDADRYRIGNYFHTKEEAEAMARKLQAVLKGADVIETPSEEEVKQELSYRKRMLGEEFTTDNAFGFRFGVEWFKSKIVK